VLTGDDIADVDPPTQRGDSGTYAVPVQVRDSAAGEFQQQLNDLGFTSEGVGRCSLSSTGDGVSFDHDQPQYCLLTVVDGEVLDAHSMGDGSTSQGARPRDLDAERRLGGQPDLPDERTEPATGPVALGQPPSRQPARPLDFENDQIYSIEPAHATQFKEFSVLIGLLSVITVSGVVYARYTDTRVALPMIVTAVAEVVILLGFAALIRMPLDLSHVAGFIAVVGTGVDDLVIIADEVMDEGDVSSERVFQSRFRKAFWVIGAAAATTVVAPLAARRVEPRRPQRIRDHHHPRRAHWGPHHPPRLR